MEKPVVTVVCLCYNHENYMRKALDSIVVQKTSFPFEILIHDDASTDKSVEIINEYKSKYPELIRTIIQTENQMGQGVNINDNFIIPEIRGDYVAWCECDDYWTDENKLQIQYDYMISNPDCTMCTHQTTVHNCVTNIDSDNNACKEDRDFSAADVIKMSGAAFATNSIFVKKDVYCNMPDYFSESTFWDYQLMIYGAHCGRLHFLSRNMSTYNMGTVGSWTESFNNSKKKSLSFCESVIRLLTSFDEATDFIYTEAVQVECRRMRYGILRKNGHFFKLRQPEFRELYKKNIEETGTLKLFLKCAIYRFDPVYELYMKMSGRRK